MHGEKAGLCPLPLHVGCVQVKNSPVISWDCLKPMWLLWVPHISGTGHNPFSLPSLELYGCLLTFVGSQNRILKQVYRAGQRNECTWGFTKSWYESGRKRKTQRPVSESSSWSFWRKPPEVQHPVPITEVKAQDPWDSLETFHPLRHLKINKAHSEKNREPAKEKNVAISCSFLEAQP